MYLNFTVNPQRMPMNAPGLAGEIFTWRQYLNWAERRLKHERPWRESNPQPTA